jgi:hypothetical protein
MNAALLDIEKALSPRKSEADAIDRQVGPDPKDHLLPAHCWRGIPYRTWWVSTVTALLGASAVSCSRIRWVILPRYLQTLCHG